MPEPSEVKEQVQQKIGEFKEQVTGQATGRLEEQKAAASGGLSTVAHAFRQTGKQLRGQEQEGVVQYIDQAAERIEHFSDYLGQRDMRELARDAERFARREPAIFLGGAFAVGMLAARFLKSSGAAGGMDQDAWRGQADWYGQGSAMGGTRPSVPRAASPAPYTPTFTPASPTMGTPASPTMGGAQGMTTPASPQGGTRPTTPSSPASGLRGTTTGMPSTTPTGGGTRSPGMSTSSDVIVGGPPIDDAVMGGPPIDRGRETR